MIRLLALTLLALAAAPAGAACPLRTTCVALATEAGTIVLALETRRAPITAANFLRYVDQKRLDGTGFYRAARNPNMKRRGFIQGGIRRNYRRMLPPITHEPTSRTGLRHVDGTISMARTAPGTATGEFFIMVGPGPSMDARRGGKGDTQGFAAFGQVVSGMDVVRRILGRATVPNAGAGALRGQYLAKPVRILTARRTA